jgi:hypothetical protein
MRPSLNLVVCSLFTLGSAGCVSVNSYVEGGHDMADFRELHSAGQPQPVRVVAQFKSNGQRRPELDQRVCNAVIEVLARSKVYVPVSGDPGTTLKVVIDDRYDSDQATGQGIESGMTLGLTNVIARDDYHFYVTLESPGSDPRVGSYRHAMITVAGRSAKAAASYGPPLNADDAFDVIVREAIVEFIENVQQSGNGAVIFVPDSSLPDNAAPPR